MSNMRSKTLILAALASAALTAPTQAAPWQDRYETRSDRQSARIERGVSTGHINAREAARLDARLGRIDTRQTRLAADGYSRRDHARIATSQAGASRAIARARLNRR